MSITRPSKKTVDRALKLRAAREYIIAHPGCTTGEIYGATQVGTTWLRRLVVMKLVKFTQRMEPGKVSGRKCVQRYYATSAPETPVE